MLSNKEIVCPDNLLKVAKKKKDVSVGIVNAGKPLPMHSAMEAVKENLITPIFIGDKNEIQKCDFKNPKNTLISNVTSREVSDALLLKELLVKQIESRVRWRECVNLMIEKNVNQFIEIGPGKVLSGLIKRIDRNVKVSAINNEEDIKQININHADCIYILENGSIKIYDRREKGITFSSDVPSYAAGLRMVDSHYRNRTGK